MLHFQHIWLVKNGSWWDISLWELLILSHLITQHCLIFSTFCYPKCFIFGTFDCSKCLIFSTFHCSKCLIFNISSPKMLDFVSCDWKNACFFMYSFKLKIRRFCLQTYFILRLLTTLWNLYLRSYEKKKCFQV